MSIISDLTKRIDEALKTLKLSAEGGNVELASSRLQDGTAVEAEEFVSGQVLYVVTADGERMPAPEGTHQLESGERIVVGAEGVISEVLPEADDDSEEMKELKEKFAALQAENEDLKTKLSAADEASKAAEAKFSELEAKHKEVTQGMEAQLTEFKAELSAIVEGSNHNPHGNPNGAEDFKNMGVELGASTLDRVNAFLSK